MAKQRAAIGLLLMSVLLTMGFVRAPSAQRSPKRRDVQDFLTVRPVDGPGGTEGRVRGAVGRDPRCANVVTIQFADHANVVTNLASVPAGAIDVTINIPTGAALGSGWIQARKIVFRFFPRPGCQPMIVGRTSFTVTNGPGIFRFAPRSGHVGTIVTITGIRFSGTSAVTFNSTPSVFTVDSDGQITATVPTGASTGPIEVDTSVGAFAQKAISGPDFVICSTFCG